VSKGIVLCTKPPRFRVVAGALHCELVSGPETYVFCISKHDTQIAMAECADAFAAWDSKPSTVAHLKKHRHD
jgi:hypothetical protein